MIPRVRIQNGPPGPQAEMYRLVDRLTADSVVLRAAGEGPELVYLWSGEFVSGPEAFRGSSIRTSHLKRPGSA